MSSHKSILILHRYMENTFYIKITCTFNITEKINVKINNEAFRPAGYPKQSMKGCPISALECTNGEFFQKYSFNMRQR